MLKKRSEMRREYRWNVEAMYPDDETWNKDLEALRADSSKPAEFKGRS